MNPLVALWLSIIAVGLIAAAVSPTFRARLVEQLVGQARAVRELCYVMPLRAVTGRRRPDYARIAHLERELETRS